jgi:hypothetical protein
MENLREAMNAALIDGKLPCAQAFAIADRLNLSALAVGQAATQESVKISHCQLGLFGHVPGKRSPAPSASEILDSAKQLIRSHLVQGDLPCESAWQIADELGISRSAVAAAADAIDIRISACQLGCFT